MEARLEESGKGLAPETDGWFVLNARDAHWKDSGPFGVYCAFEGKRRFPQFGFNISVLQPGQSLGRCITPSRAIKRTFSLGRTDPVSTPPTNERPERASRRRGIRPV